MWLEQLKQFVLNFSKTELVFFPFLGISMLCATLVFAREDKKMIERIFSPQKSEFYKSMLFVHLQQVNLFKISSNCNAFSQRLHAINFLWYTYLLTSYIFIGPHRDTFSFSWVQIVLVVGGGCNDRRCCMSPRSFCFASLSESIKKLTR